MIMIVCVNNDYALFRVAPAGRLYCSNHFFLQILEATDTEPVGSIIRIRRISGSRIKVQIEGVSARRTGRPVVTVRPLIVQGSIVPIAVAG